MTDQDPRLPCLLGTLSTYKQICQVFSTSAVIACQPSQKYCKAYCIVDEVQSLCLSSYELLFDWVLLFDVYVLMARITIYCIPVPHDHMMVSICMKNIIPGYREEVIFLREEYFPVQQFSVYIFKVLAFSMLAPLAMPLH
jgi:hypothetical protein